MIVNIDNKIIDLTSWLEEGRIQQAKVLEAMIERYFVKLKLQRTLKLIENVLNDKYN